MEDWKDLDIKDIPGDFFDNENYEIEIYGVSSQWLSSDFNPIEDRYHIIGVLREGNDKYRYRLKPLKSMRVSRDHFNKVKDSKIFVVNRDKNNDKWIDGRKVEIID